MRAARCEYFASCLDNQIIPVPSGENSSPVSEAGENSSPVSEACEKIQSHPGPRKKSSPVSEARRGSLVKFFFVGRPGRDGTGFFISRAGTGLDLFARGAKNPVPSSLFFAAKKKSSPVDLKNPVPSGALLHSMCASCAALGVLRWLCAGAGLRWR